MKSLLVALFASISFCLPVFADPEIEEWNTHHSMGCMLLKDCTEDIEQIKTIEDIEALYPGLVYPDTVRSEIAALLEAVDAVGSKIYIADQKYFPKLHRGVYHTISNDFFLNYDFMHRPNTLLAVMRHEAFHAVQDCMAGTIENPLIAIVHPEEAVPYYYRKMAEHMYPPEVVPWEAEALWAGHTEGITIKGLKSCAAGTMWEDNKPTPMTEEWLRENGYIE